jgi:hypothetical protein
MGKALLIFLLLGPLALHFALASSRESASAADAVLAGRARREVARQAAYSGLAEAERRVLPALAETGFYGGPEVIEGAYEGGTFRATIAFEDDGDYTLRATGLSDAAEKTVLRTYRLEGEEPPVSDFMDPAYFINQNLLSEQRFHVTAEDPTRNVVVHTNKNMYIGHRDTYVTGFARHTWNFELGRGLSATSIFRPNTNPDNLPLHAPAPAIPMPAPDAQRYRSIATRYTPGDLYLSGDVELGTRMNPVVWFVENDLRTSGDVTFSGYGVFIMGNGAQFSRNVTAPAGPNGESTVMYYTNNTVVIKDRPATVTGQFYIGDSLQVDQSVTVVGSVAIYNSMRATAGLTIRNRPSSFALTRVLWPPGTGPNSDWSAPGADAIALVSSREW